MALIFLEFPWAAIDKICNFSNDKTLIEMRQVCDFDSLFLAYFTGLQVD